MFLIRNQVFFFLPKYNILFIARYIPDKYNTLSDVHSQLQVIKSRSLMPEADEQANSNTLSSYINSLYQEIWLLN